MLLKDLQSVVGRLLWLTGAWHYLRPLLIPLYRALRRIPVTPDATAAQGLSWTPGMAQILCQYFLFMRRVHVFPQLSHTPGHLNGLADALSRFGDFPLTLSPTDQIEINVPFLMCQNGIHVTNQ